MAEELRQMQQRWKPEHARRYRVVGASGTLELRPQPDGTYAPVGEANAELEQALRGWMAEVAPQEKSEQDMEALKALGYVE